MDKPMHVATYLPSLRVGGTERVNVSLMNFLVSRGYDVTAVVHEADGEFRSALPPAVTVVDLAVNRTLFAIPKLARWLHRAKPDILFSSLGHNNIAALCAGALSGVDTRIVISQHAPLSLESKSQRSWQHRLLPLMYRAVGGYAHAIVAVSSGVARDFIDMTGLMADKISVIHNPVIYRDFARDAAQPVSHRWLDDPALTTFIAVGRLAPEKDLPTLLTAFSTVRRNLDVRLLILGEGPERAAIERMVVALGLQNDVELLGYSHNPLPYMRKAAALILSSRYEGFGNVLVEALACGTPVASTDCPYGPSEILDNGQFGLLVPVGDAPAMAQAMARMLENRYPAQLLRDRASDFTIDVIGQRYLDLFSSVLRSATR
jgi:glycosyltransferase involved in cell wall biosynthesis